MIALTVRASRTLTAMFAVVAVRDGVLPAGADEAIAECGGNVIVAGSRPADADLAGLARQVRLVELGDFQPGRWAELLAPVIEDTPDADVVVLPASSDGRDLAPRLAARLGRPLFAGATEVRDGAVWLARRGGFDLVRQPMGDVAVVTLQPGIRGVEPHDADPDVSSVDVATSTESVDAKVVDVLPPDVSTMDLSEARRIVGGGAGLDGADRFGQLDDVAHSIGATTGATRVVTDRGWVPHERQIGTTGVVVDPVLYLSFGISGAVQHTSGLGDPDHVISVNTDPHCPMMQMSDLAIVSDANAVLDELVRLVSGTNRTQIEGADV